MRQNCVGDRAGQPPQSVPQTIADRRGKGQGGTASRGGGTDIGHAPLVNPI